MWISELVYTIMYLCGWIPSSSSFRLRFVRYFMNYVENEGTHVGQTLSGVPHLTTPPSPRHINNQSSRELWLHYSHNVFQIRVQISNYSEI